MTVATTTESMSPQLLRVAERAKRDPQGAIFSLARLIDEPALHRAYAAIRKDAAVGVDGVTKEQYGQNLESNLKGLHERMCASKYRHQPIRRVHIPKDQGKTRPIGISTLEDKVVQRALTEVLEVLYEPKFYGFSYGFRRGRGAHQALAKMQRMLHERRVSWIIEADIKAYFDSIDRKKLMEMLRMRVADETFMRLIGKCLKVGVLDGEEYSEPDTGTAQGSVLSPMLGNVYLHHVLDEWLENEVRPRLKGRMEVIRYADDFVIGFSLEQDAMRVMAVLGKRLERYGLALHPDKTRVFRFAPPEAGEKKGPERTPAPTFDFLGFNVYWRRSRHGLWMVGLQTRRARLKRASTAANEWCRSHRHLPVVKQHATLSRKLEGHYNYFGVNGNWHLMEALFCRVRRIWRKWLNRRSQRGRMTWARYKQLLEKLPLPRPTIRVQIWG